MESKVRVWPVVREEIRYSEFINIWVRDAPDPGGELAELAEVELVGKFADGCRLADEKLGFKSRCEECPFDDCKLSKAEAAADDGLITDYVEMRREYENKKHLRDVLSSGWSVMCCECGVWLNASDDVYRRRNDRRGRCWCESCCCEEVVALLYIRLFLGNWVMEKRRYERVWKSDFE